MAKSYSQPCGAMGYLVIPVDRDDLQWSVRDFMRTELGYNWNYSRYYTHLNEEGETFIPVWDKDKEVWVTHLEIPRKFILKISTEQWPRFHLVFSNLNLINRNDEDFAAVVFSLHIDSYRHMGDFGTMVEWECLTEARRIELISGAPSYRK